MFVEKYRPKEFNDVVGLDPSIVKLMDENMPHFLFLGPAGTGKTTTARIIITKTGADVLRLNGSDERGIDTIRQKVKEFAMTMSTNGNFKIVFFDEADYLTKDAQATLRNLMETYHKNCRFILTANYGNKIIDPLHSRCQKYEFKIPPKAEVATRLNHISRAEGIEWAEGAMGKLVDKYYPDIRKMVNKLEELGKKGTISADMIDIESDQIKALADHLVAKNFTQARLWCLNSCEEHSFILNNLFKHFVASDMDAAKKLKVVDAIGETEFRLGLSVDKEVQMSAGLVRIIRALI